MNTSDLVTSFLRSAEDWLCDGYAADIRYVAATKASGPEILTASMQLHPLPPQREDLSFHIAGTRFLIGQTQIATARKASLMKRLTCAISGDINVAGQTLRLVPEKTLDFYSEMTSRGQWFTELHLQVLGARGSQLSNLDLTAADTELRLATPPFDGLADVCGWLGLAAPGSGMSANSLNIRVGPPVDLIFDECLLANDRLTLTLHAHPKFDVSRVRLAVHGVPGNGLLGRQQVAGKISWARVRNGRRPGTMQISLPKVDGALAMLMIENATVRRQWFIDPSRARNNRYLAVQHFDRDLRMVRAAVLESMDATKFERGIAALLFLLGFTPSVQLETDAPDLVVATPNGKITLVECTIRTADIASKIGKIVDRRGSLSKYLAASGHPADVNAVLVCRSPLDQLTTHATEAFKNKVMLVTNENLLAAFDRVRSPLDPDKVLADALVRLAHEPSFNG